MKKVLSIIFVLVLSVSFLTADVYIKQKIHTDAVTMMGQTTPATDDFQEMWMGKNKMAMHSKDRSFIIDMDKKIARMINHKAKVYIEMAMPVDISQYLPEEMAQMAQMMMNVTITVNPTSETQTIGKWNCTGYDVEMGMMMFKMKMKVWASKDVPFDWKMFSETMYSEMTKAMMRLPDDAVKELLKIEGFQIKTEMTMSMMGSDMKSYQEVVEITKKSPPTGTYSVPEGYKKQDKLTREDMMKR